MLLAPAEARPRPAVPLRAGLVCALLAGVLLVLVVAEWGPLMALDRAVADGLHRRAVADPGLTHVNRVLTDWVWDPWTMRALLAVVVAVLLWRGERLLPVWVAATSGLGTAVQQGLKAAVDRDRPQWPDPVDSAGYAAFPSGHALSVTVAFGLLGWLLALHGAGRRTRTAVLAIGAVSALGVGFTRLFLGVHWFSDVMGGWLTGVAIVTLSAAAHERWALKRRG
ncbi:phosphatase PAP2 family protein [Streptomyces violascens]|uniref:Phosphatase PAP2 family protein n=1 Tax=Streptomyces violascens TaxID=67381 RepID=A0ABQ3QGZ5_9ACTN|nr:phosphatase PAP2 family protein [Streptomyces violascens]GGT90807.1 phosphatase PAP2 family protein [Streptomyces violascens]GHI36547.1 phosphatase PAP2 family protein [Streptomyces violascens]